MHFVDLDIPNRIMMENLQYQMHVEVISEFTVLSKIMIYALSME